MAQAGFPMAVGTFSYNGYTFNEGAMIEEVSHVPHRDDANRTVSYWETTITVKFVVADSVNGTDLDLEDLRVFLAQDGGELRYTGRGFGLDLIFNAFGSLSDVRWGPKVNTLTWQPVGSVNAALVTWSVTVAHNFCPLFSFAEQNLLEYNYGISYAITNGNTTRTISGYILIAQTRQGFGLANNRRNVVASADEFLDRIIHEIPVGFKRDFSRSISADKSRLDFTVTDTQIPSENPYPSQVVEIDANQSLNYRLPTSSSDTSGAGPTGSIAANITLGAGVDGKRALQVFLANIALPRLRFMRQRQPILVTSIRVDENMFDRRHSFSLSFLTFGILRNLATGYGFWEPVPGTNWIAWRNSLLNDSFHNRGNAKLADYGSDDIIVELCDPNIPTATGESAVPARRLAGEEQGINECPDPEESWLNFDTELATEADRPTAQISVQQEEEDTLETGWETDEQPPTDPTEWPQAGDNPDVITSSGRLRYKFTFKGTATRVCYHIPRPVLRAIGGKDAIPIKYREKERILGNAFGMPVIQKAWIGEYFTEDSPESTPPPFNPRLMVDPDTLDTPPIQ